MSHRNANIQIHYIGWIITDSFSSRQKVIIKGVRYIKMVKYYFSLIAWSLYFLVYSLLASYRICNMPVGFSFVLWGGNMCMLYDLLVSLRVFHKVLQIHL